ncbi:MAG: hypothetical protein H0T89_31260 [Deltaproteobacteria bacterium]|nr:hypothetical protein [Deltaproteobacteria bacterium]
MTLSPLIRSTCRDYFGRHVTRGGKRQLVDNRCNACPLRTPCLAFGGAPARTFGELEEAREVFARAAEVVHRG